MEYKETDIKGVWIIEPKVFNDARGYFMEAWKKEEFEAHVGKKDTILSNEEIITMDWLFSNIVGEIPAKYELKEQAKPIVELQGVKGEKE